MKEVKLKLNPIEYCFMILFNIMKVFSSVYTKATANVYRLKNDIFYGDEVVIERVSVLSFGMTRITSLLEDSREYKFGVSKYSEIYKSSGLYTFRDVIEYIKLYGDRINITKGIDVYMIPDFGDINNKSMSLYKESISIINGNIEEKIDLAILAMKPTKENPTLTIVGIPEYFIDLTKHKNSIIADRHLSAYITYITGINQKLIDNMR